MVLVPARWDSLQLAEPLPGGEGQIHGLSAAGSKTVGLM